MVVCRNLRLGVHHEMDKFYQNKTKIGDYGEKSTIQSLDKMKLCKYICELDDKELERSIKAVYSTSKKSSKSDQVRHV